MLLHLGWAPSHYIWDGVETFHVELKLWLTLWPPTSVYFSIYTLFIFFYKGGISAVSKRLDARYDWLPSPDSLSKFGHIRIVYIGDACNANISENVSGRLALVSPDGQCSYFTKVLSNEERLGLIQSLFNLRTISFSIFIHIDTHSSTLKIPYYLLSWE